MIYDNLEHKAKITKEVFKADISFLQGASVNITDTKGLYYNIRFYNHKTNELIWQDNITDGYWTSPSIKYYIKWRVEVWKGDTKIKEEILDCTNKNILINLDSKSIGDTLAWFPYVEEFRKRHKCNIYCSTFHNDWFAKKYPEINFVPPGMSVPNAYAQYSIGWFYNEDDTYKPSHNPVDFKNYPLQKTASDILGLPYREIKPNLVTKKTHLPTNKKYVVIAPHGSKHSSYWQYPGGWQTVIDFLKQRDYKVVMMSGEPLGDTWHDSKLGGTLTGVINRTGTEGDILEKFYEIKNAKALIGIGSGLSWVSWALGVPTVLISGFSEAYAEMADCYRVTTPEGNCTGCFNKHRLDPGDWEWCPHHKNTMRHFECSKSITPWVVISNLKKALNIY